MTPALHWTDYVLHPDLLEVGFYDELSIQSITYSVYDTNGDLLLSHSTATDWTRTFAQNGILHRTDYIYWNAGDTIGGQNDIAIVYFRGWDMIDTVIEYPAPPEVFSTSSFYATLNGYWDLTGLITDMQVVSDSDGDGVPDTEDACVNSDLRETVVIGEKDSKVANILFEDGCTISDMIAVIAEASDNNRTFRKALRKLLRALEKADEISKKDKKAIEKTARKPKGKGKGKAPKKR